MEGNVRSLRETYVTLAGEELELPPGKALQYLAQVRQAAEAPSVDVAGITDLVWSHQNPLLRAAPISGAPSATRETYEHPVFRAMLDCISRKRMATGDLDLSAAAAKYTVPVPEAAQQLGLNESSVRRAIASGRLSAWKRGGTYFLDPASVSAYQVSVRGAKAITALHIREGTAGDQFLRVKHRGPIPLQTRMVDGAKEWTLPRGWQRVAVLTGDKAAGTYRFHVLLPDPDASGDQFLRHAGFEVRGRFRLEGKPISNPRAATEAWEAFLAE